MWGMVSQCRLIEQQVGVKTDKYAAADCVCC